MGDVEVAVVPADDQYQSTTLEPGESLDIGNLTLECIAVRGNKIKVVIHQKRLTVKRTIDNVSTTR